MLRRLLLAIGLLIAFSPVSTFAQDVEMLGRRYGTRPPDAYYAAMARNPNAFRFNRGRSAQMRNARALRSLGPAGARAGGPALGLGPRDEAVVGDFYVPVLLGLFADSPASPPVTRSSVQDGYFGPGVGTVAGYYSEVSSDSITLIGDVQDWVRSSMTQDEATEGISGLDCCGIGDYIRTLLALQGPGVDWGTFDNDGPDGIPNSGDDDGYVDALAVIHPTAGAECLGSHPDRIWSHKWSLADASTGGSYETGTASNAVGVPFIRVDDYFVQGAVPCSGVGLNDIGVFTHELGHAFGLPDLYDTRSFGQPHDGAGSWELMASGTWGCSGTTPYSPCHMGAWSKAMLGWLTVDTLPPDTDLGTLTLPPVETTGFVYRVDAGDGSGEYFLLENRQRSLTTYDQGLPAEGLLIWQIDADWVDARWVGNTVNASDHMGVWLRQADGLDELGQPGGDRGDAGDPFPGSTGNTEFHAATNPASRSFQGTASGLSLLDVGISGDNVTFHALTRFASAPDFVIDLIATVPQDVQLTVQDGTPPVVWSVVAGSPPEGIAVQVDGRVTGASVDIGVFPFVVEATDGLGLTATANVTLDVAEPAFSVQQLAADFLLGPQPLDSVQAVFVDRQGNNNGTYDLGDFRAWILARPILPLSADLAGAERRVVTLPVPLLQREERR